MFLIVGAFVFFTACEKTPALSSPDIIVGSEFKTEVKPTIIEIDSCEYIQYQTKFFYGVGHAKIEYYPKLITHKGNCKYCIERNKKAIKNALLEHQIK